MPREDSRAPKGAELDSHEGWLPVPSGRLLGVDLVPVADVAKAMDRFGDRYLNRVYTQREIASAGSPGDPPEASAPSGPSRSVARAPHFAARFAAKEAVFKALHGGSATSSPEARDLPFDWRTIEVLRRPDGSPALCLHGAMRGLAEQRRVRHLDLSLSHDGEYAIAVVVGEASRVPGEM